MRHSDEFEAMGVHTRWGIWWNVGLSQTNSPLPPPVCLLERLLLRIHTEEIIPLRDRKILQQYLAAACRKGHKQRDSYDRSIWTGWKTDSTRAEFFYWECQQGGLNTLLLKLQGFIHCRHSWNYSLDIFDNSSLPPASPNISYRSKLGVMKGRHEQS